MAIESANGALAVWDFYIVPTWLQRSEQSVAACLLRTSVILASFNAAVAMGVRLLSIATRAISAHWFSGSMVLAMNDHPGGSQAEHVAGRM